SLGGMLGGGGKPPATLVTLTPEAPAPAQMVRDAAAGQSVTIEVPTVPRELTFVRVPVQLTPTNVQYVANLQLVDTPNRLFQPLQRERPGRWNGSDSGASPQPRGEPGRARCSALDRRVVTLTRVRAAV